MPQSIACKSLYCSLRWAAEATEKNDGSKLLYCSLRWVTPLDLTISLGVRAPLDSTIKSIVVLEATARVHVVEATTSGHY